MKTDRLYAITLHLLNHGKTTAKELSQKFEVSLRTIQRDVDSLCQAGIPVVAETGINGGYYLSDNFRMTAQTASDDEYSFILMALKGFSTAMQSPQIDIAVEKITALTKDKNESIILDFSVLREGDNKLLQLLQTAIHEKNPVRFEYTNAENISRVHTVEPVAVVYRWYAWYLLAYSTVKNDYRTYKIVRMSNAKIVDGTFSQEHSNAENILKDNDKKAPQKSTKIQVRCKKKARAKAIEYLNGKVTHEYDNGDCEMTLHVIESEHFWFGTMLSLGADIEIISPEHIRTRVLKAAEEIISLYSKL